MSDKLRQSLRRIAPLIAVQIFLACLNLATGLNGGFWAIYPILAMGIPEFIILSRALLSDDNRQPLMSASAQMQPAAQPISNKMPAMMPSQFVEPTFASDVARVRTYRQDLERLAKNAGGSARGLRLTDLARQFADWERDVQGMAGRITSFKRNSVVQQDLRAVPEAIEKLAGQRYQHVIARVINRLDA